jgi:O-antigen/teichoic acid export membrane protein
VANQALTAGQYAGPSSVIDEADSQEHAEHPVVQRLSRDVTVGQGARQGAAWITASRLSWQAFQFLVSLITARLLLPSQFGEAALVLTIAAFAQLFTDLGLAAAVVHARRVTESLLSTTFWLNLLTGIVLCALISALSVPISHLYGHGNIAPLLVLASTQFILNSGAVQLAVLERTFHFKRLAVLETVSNVVGIAAIPVAALLDAGTASLIIGPLVTTALLTMGLWASVPWRPHRRPDLASMAELWRFSRGLVGFNAVNFWTRNLDTLLLGRFATTSQLGEYTRSYALTIMPVQQMTMVVGRVLFPSLARLRDEPRRMGLAWVKGMSAATGIVMPITVTLATTAPALVPVLYGERWTGMVVVLELLAVATLPQLVGSASGSLYRAAGQTDLLFRLGLLTSFLGVVAIVAGLPWGTRGVAFALCIQSWIVLPIVLVPIARNVHLRPLEILRPVLAGSLPTLALAVGMLAGRGVGPPGAAAG